jgi:hypothetical protein
VGPQFSDLLGKVVDINEKSWDMKFGEGRYGYNKDPNKQGGGGWGQQGGGQRYRQDAGRAGGGSGGGGVGGNNQPRSDNRGPRDRESRPHSTPRRIRSFPVLCACHSLVLHNCAGKADSGVRCRGRLVAARELRSRVGNGIWPCDGGLGFRGQGLLPAVACNGSAGNEDCNRRRDG